MRLYLKCTDKMGDSNHFQQQMYVLNNFRLLINATEINEARMKMILKENNYTFHLINQITVK